MPQDMQWLYNQSDFYNTLPDVCKEAIALWKDRSHGTTLNINMTKAPCVQQYAML